MHLVRYGILSFYHAKSWEGGGEAQLGLSRFPRVRVMVLLPPYPYRQQHNPHLCPRPPFTARHDPSRPITVCVESSSLLLIPSFPPLSGPETPFQVEARTFGVVAAWRPMLFHSHPPSRLHLHFHFTSLHPHCHPPLLHSSGCVIPVSRSRLGDSKSSAPLAP
jgi:hypothetical protein